MIETRIRLPTKLAIIAAFLAVALVGYFVGNPTHRYKASEENACREQCSKLKRTGHLVSQNPVGSLNPGRFDGPWRCECE